MIRLFRVYVSASTVLLFLSEILLILAAFVGASYAMLEVDPTDYLLYDSGFTSILLVTAGILAGLYFRDLYTQVRVKSRIALLQQLCMVMGMAFLMEGLISYLDPDLRVPIRVMVSGSAMAIVAIFGLRLLFGSYAFPVMVGDRLLLVGGSPLLAALGQYVEDHPESGLAVTGHVHDRGDTPADLIAGKRLGPLRSLSEIVEATNPSRIVVGVSGASDPVLASQLLDILFCGHAIEEAASTYEKVCGRVAIEALRPAQMIYSRRFGPPVLTESLRDFCNLAAACLGILVSSPVMILAAVVQRLSSAGPLLDRQPRVGLDDRAFTRYRFRSNGTTWAARTVRRLHWDGLPQLFNVLRGDMAIVGPRAERPEFVEVLSRLIPCYSLRHRVRPGMTGWSQIKFYDPAPDTLAKLEYDLYYVKNASLSLDTAIVFHTLKSIVLNPAAE